MLAFADGGAHGVVVVEAPVSAKGNVTNKKVVTDGTGDETLAFLAEREIRGAKSVPSIRNCVPRSFVYTRTFSRSLDLASKKLDFQFSSPV